MEPVKLTSSESILLIKWLAMYIKGELKVGIANSENKKVYDLIMKIQDEALRAYLHYIVYGHQPEFPVLFTIVKNERE